MGSAERRVLTACAAGALAVTGGGLGGYVTSVMVKSHGEAAAAENADLRRQIVDQRARAGGLVRDLAAAQDENEDLVATLKVASAMTCDRSRLADLQQALQEPQGQGDPVTRTLPVTQTLQVQSPVASPVRPVAVATLSVRQASAPADHSNPEALRLMARGEQLIGQGDISAARQMLERAADLGHPPALFELAETYDPNTLAGWGTLGTQGDVGRARILYGKALAAGVAEAGTRLKALP